jgi:four helix bundle protein
MRRAAVSVGSNIAEGCGRNSDREFASFLNIAMGSASELRFQIELAKRLQFAPNEQVTSWEALVNEVMRMLSRLIVAVKARIKRAEGQT